MQKVSQQKFAFKAVMQKVAQEKFGFKAVMQNIAQQKFVPKLSAKKLPNGNSGPCTECFEAKSGTED